MENYQRMLFDWVASQPGLTGAVVLGAGLLSGFLGYRMIRFLVVLSTGGLGTLLASVAAGLAGYPIELPAVIGGAVGGLCGLVWHRAALTASVAGTGAVLGAYLATQFGIQGIAAWIAMGVCAIGGLVLAILNPKAMGLAFTTLLGSMLMIIGFVGLTNAVCPSLANTFRGWAHRQSLIVPALMVMVAVTAYSVQASRLQGDLRTGQ